MTLYEFGVLLNVSAFDRRLDPALTTPIAVALSGGGDSLAALHLTKAWADRNGRRVLALSVDHRLQPQSADWTRFCEKAALRLGADFRALAWDGPKPCQGLPAAARAARHRLIADAARAAGARVVVFGHTAGDVREAELMRASGVRVGTPREWSPSPVWPEGRGLFLLRPLLNLRRASIRRALAEAGETWIDDPANDDLRSPRARARRQAGESLASPPNAADGPGLAALARRWTISPLGFFRIDRQALREAPAPNARRLLAAAVLSVGGGERPPRGERLDRLFAQALAAEPFRAALSGTKLIADQHLLIVRDAGEARRGGLAPASLAPGVPAVWDGRFEIVAPCGVVRPLAGVMAHLNPAQRLALKAVPAPARPALPLLIAADGTLVCPILAGALEVSVATLVGPRFLGACGAISKEPAT